MVTGVIGFVSVSGEHEAYAGAMRGGESVPFGICSLPLLAHRPLDPLSIVLEIPRRCTVSLPPSSNQIPCSGLFAQPPDLVPRDLLDPRIPELLLSLSRKLGTIFIDESLRATAARRAPLLAWSSTSNCLKKEKKKKKKIAAKREKGVAPERGGQSTISIVNRSSGEYLDRLVSIRMIRADSRTS